MIAAIWLPLGTLLFLITLLTGHGYAGWDEALKVPFSQWRDGPYYIFGYIHFALSLACSLLILVLIFRQGHRGEILTGFCIVLLLIVVIVTPSHDVFHRYSSYVLFLMLMSYYTWVLWRWHPRYVMVHLAILLALALLTTWHSYGFWQKTLVLYVLVLMNIQGLYLQSSILNSNSSVTN
ncbi:MAG TPA: hypothetical protein PLN21_11490 [Gemmatales bacterium]|nr:hypothetical protein [Gemmatales bacterium]